MNDLNSVILEGRLTAEPEVGYEDTGRAVCRFVIASKRYHRVDDKYEEEISHFGIVVHDRLAEICHENLHEQSGVRVVGRLRAETCGALKKARPVVIRAEHIEFKPEKRKG